MDQRDHHTWIRSHRYWEPPAPHDQRTCTCSTCRRWRYEQRRYYLDVPEPEWTNHQ